MANEKSTSSSSSPSTTSDPLILSAISYGRVFIGSALILAPNLLCNICTIPLSPYTSTFMRLVGVRDAVLGEHLWLSTRSGLPAGPVHAIKAGSVDEAKRAEVRRNLMAHMAVDGLETLLLAALYAKGGVINGRLAFVGGVGSAAFLGLDAIAFRNV